MSDYVDLIIEERATPEVIERALDANIISGLEYNEPSDFALVKVVNYQSLNEVKASYEEARSFCFDWLESEDRDEDAIAVYFNAAELRKTPEIIALEANIEKLSNDIANVNSLAAVRNALGGDYQDCKSCKSRVAIEYCQPKNPSSHWECPVCLRGDLRPRQVREGSAALTDALVKAEKHLKEKLREMARAQLEGGDLLVHTLVATLAF
jgi:hypothetical protein